MKHLLLAGLAAALAAGSASAASPPEKVVKETVVTKEVVETKDKEVEGADTPAAALVNDCSARKFETSAVLEKDGQKRVTKLKLCSTPDADAASWIRTLESAKGKLAAIPNISLESRTKIEAEMNAEIERLKTPAH